MGTEPPAGSRKRKIWETASAAQAHGLGVNAGYDLDRHNPPIADRAAA